MFNSKGTTTKTTSPTELVAPFGSDHLWHDADRRTKHPHLDQIAAVTLALPAAPAGQYNGLQLDGGECAVHGVDPGDDVPLLPWAITPDGHVLHACGDIQCPPAAEVLPAGIRLAEQAIRAALTAADRPHDVVRRLLLAVIEIAEDVSPFCDQSDWSNADRASNPFYRAADTLINEVVRRHAEGAQADGLTAAAGALDTRDGLQASVELAIARCARPELYATSGEDE
ncbi:hypothetical protein OG689_19655 [Kitasatospora sp. NBC_00240]|uniref:hypothetical protein n=1 Tax=Kitasatospora sp. NBC_00240 TaxID=2903567 RepID=UPI00224EEA14|nr:hypothetical protein [Kitasatospora sp. NBC_00240]MCX5211478.1 hypothetical protein [Kitasatospora sp. NBC_00240]